MPSQPDRQHPTAAEASRGRPRLVAASLALFVIIGIAWTCWHIDASKRFEAETYFVAGRAMAKGLDPYVHETGYIYPPFLAHALAGLPSSSQVWLWNAMVSLSAFVLIGATLVLARLHTSKAAVLGALLFFGYEVGNVVDRGNAQLPVAALLALTLLAVDRGRHVTAGVLLGLAAAVKVTPSLLILFLALRATFLRDRPVARAGASASIIALSTLLLPWTGRWIDVTMQGVPAANRSLSGGNLSWYAFFAQAGVHLPGYLPVLLAVAVVLLMARSRRLELAPALAIAVVLALAATPVAWGYAYLNLLPVAAVLYRELGQGRHFLPAGRGRQLAEYASILVFAIFSVNADFFYVRQVWSGRYILPLFPLLGTLALAGAIGRCQHGRFPSGGDFGPAPTSRCNGA